MSGRKIDVEIMAVVFEFVRLIQELEVRILLKKCFKRLFPGESFFVYHGANLFHPMFLGLNFSRSQIIKHLQWATLSLTLRGRPEGSN